jgi:hypothetical protein
MPALRRRRPEEPAAATPSTVPWALGALLRDGPAPLVPRAISGGHLSVILVLGPGHATPADVGLPLELLRALAAEDVDLQTLTAADLEDLDDNDLPPPPAVEVTDGGALRITRRADAPPAADTAPADVSPPAAATPVADTAPADVSPPAAATPAGAAASGDASPPAAAPPRGPLAAADVVLAAGWAAAPAVLTAPGLRARAVLATAEPPPLAALGWTAGVPVLGPAWLGGALPPGADKAYVPMPVHRREDLVLIHGEEPFGLLAAAELARRREDLTFALSGVRPDLELPFPFLGVEQGAAGLAHAFASATVALAPPVRGWRPAALAMLACGQVVVAPDDAAGRAALGDGTAVLAAGPLEAADAVEHLLTDLTARAERTRAGLRHVTAGWPATAAALAAALRALG